MDECKPLLLGRINIAYSLEPNYFTYRTIKDDKAGAKAATKAAEGAAAEVGRCRLPLSNPR